MPRASDRGDQSPGGFREASTKRFFRIPHERPDDHSGWYYQAREGTFGPFPNREQAEQDLAQRIGRRHVGQNAVYRLLGLLLGR